MNSSKAERLEEVRSLIRAACLKAGRKENNVRLIAVSKTKTAEDVEDFANLGVKDFGENYVQEALAKIDTVKNPEILWHFIGSLQSNKAKFLPNNFCLFHGLDSESVAKKLDSAAFPKKMDCLVEINIDDATAKAGILPSRTPEFLAKMSSLPNIEIKGFMCIPEVVAGRDPRKPFAEMRELLEKANKSSYYRSKLTELSMGMSNDFESAILEGATMVRVGTRLFGERTKK